MEPVLITPAQHKDYRNRHVARAWDLAEQALRKAEKVIIVGYSLPEDDLDVIYLLKRGLGQLAEKTPGSITVVERGPDETTPLNEHPVGQRYRSIFGPGIEWRTSGFEGLIAQLTGVSVQEIVRQSTVAVA